MYIKEFELAISLIDMVIRGFADALILHGRGGLGKSYTTVTTCQKKCPDGYVYHAGYMTGKQLFEYLKKHNGHIIILDDLVRLLTDDKAISILNAALWAPAGKNRIVQYTTTQRDGSTNHMEFDFNGRIILLINEIPRQRKLNIQALKSRVFVYEFNLTMMQIINISVQILRDDSFYHLFNLELSQDDREQLIKDFVEHTSLYTENLSLREMRRFVMCYAYGKEVCPENPKRHIEMYKGTIKIDEEKNLVHEFMNSNLSVGNQVSTFIEKTGKSRATFFRIKKTIQQEKEIDKKQDDSVSEQDQNTTSNSTVTSIIDSEENTVDHFSDNIHQDKSNDADVSVMKSEEITVDQFLDKIQGSGLEAKKLDRDYFCIKHNGFISNYVKKTDYGIDVLYPNDRVWKIDRIKTHDQLDTSINKINDLISKSIQEQKNLAIPEGFLNECISHLKQNEPTLKIKKGNEKNKYNIIIDNTIIAEVSQRKDGKLNLRWVTKTEMKGMIINGEKDYFKVTHLLKEFIDIYKKRNNIDRWM